MLEEKGVVAPQNRSDLFVSSGPCGGTETSASKPRPPESVGAMIARENPEFSMKLAVSRPE